jgi:hypothetical protein
MKKESKMAPVFEIEKIEYVNSNYVNYALYINGKDTKARFDFNKKKNEYQYTDSDDDYKFMNKILASKSETFPDNIFLPMSMPENTYYKEIEPGSWIMLRKQTKELHWFISFKHLSAEELFDSCSLEVFLSEFKLTIENLKYRDIRLDGNAEYKCYIPITEGQTVKENLLIFQNLISQALYETDKRMTDKRVKHLLEYQTTVVMPK